MKSLFAASAAALLFLCLAPADSTAFSKDGGGECAKCHSLTREEAAGLLGAMVDNVVGVLPGPIPGLWEVDVEKGGSVYPAYVDFSKKLLVNGQVIRLGDMENLTGLRYVDLNRVDVSTIPLDDAVILGNPAAKKRVIVFDDPDCGWCRKLHGEIKQIVAREPDVAFFVRVYSRNNNPATVEKALSIVCGKADAARLLDDAFAGKKLPAAACRSDAVEQTAKLAERLGIHGTPAMVLPDGRLIRGYMQADALLGLLQETK